MVISWRSKTNDLQSLWQMVKFSLSFLLHQRLQIWPAAQTIKFELKRDLKSPHVRQSKRGILIPGAVFRILCQWKLDSGLRSLVGFRIPFKLHSEFPKLHSGFQNPGFRIPQDKISFIPVSRSQNLLESGFPYTERLMLATTPTKTHTYYPEKAFPGCLCKTIWHLASVLARIRFS